MWTNNHFVLIVCDKKQKQTAILSTQLLHDNVLLMCSPRRIPLKAMLLSLLDLNGDRSGIEAGYGYILGNETVTGLT